MKYLLLSMVVIVAGCYAKRAPDKTGLEGKPLPNFRLVLPDSSKYAIAQATVDAKPLVLFYFSPYCPYCRTMMNEITDNIKDVSDIEFLLVTSFTLGDMKLFSDKYDLAKYKNIITGQDDSLNVANYFKVLVVPFVAIYGKDQKLRQAFTGSVEIRQIKEVIAESK